MHFFTNCWGLVDNWDAFLFRSQHFQKIDINCAHTRALSRKIKRRDTYVAWKLGEQLRQGPPLFTSLRARGFSKLLQIQERGGVLGVRARVGETAAHEKARNHECKKNAPTLASSYRNALATSCGTGSCYDQRETDALVLELEAAMR